MIVEEVKTNTVMHHSDQGKYIRQTESNMLFLIAEDVYPCPYSYVETDDVPSDDLIAEEALDIIFGGAE